MIDVEWLLTRGPQHDDTPYPDIRGNLGPLTEIAKLRTLIAPLVALLGWIPHPEIRLNRNLPPHLRQLCRTKRMASRNTWKGTNETILNRFREYLGTASDLELECIELNADECNDLWLVNLQWEIEKLYEGVEIRHKRSGYWPCG